MMYDDSSFKVFAMAFLATYWIPTALFRMSRYLMRRFHTKTPMEKAMEDNCVCFDCHEKADRQKAKRLKSISFFDIIFAVVSILLIVSAFTVYSSNIKTETPFDPFEILGVTKSSDLKSIKKAYRKLSIIHHPDKNPNDREGASARFLKISKAYAALTDETAKENYKKYGNPDGYVGTSWVIGLPEWIHDNSNLVLLLYAVFLVVVFPSLVGYWWHNSKQQLTPEIMTSTFMMYRETLMRTKRFRDLLTAFSGSDEFNDLYTTDNDEAIQELSESLRKEGEVPKCKSIREPSKSQVQNLMIMTAYLSRIPIPKKLDYVLENILMRCEPLLTSLTDTVGVFQRPDCKAAWDKWFMHGHTIFLARCLQLTQCVYQALDEKSSPLLQIPHFTQREIRFCTNRNGVTKSIYDIMRMDINDLTRMLREFSNAQLLDVKAFCDRFPVATLEVENPKVVGEDDSSVHEGDTVTVRTTLRILRRSGSAFSPCVRRLPYKKQEVWWLWLADQERQCPVEVRRLLPKMARGHDGIKRKSGFDLDEDDDEHDDGRRDTLSSASTTVSSGGDEEMSEEEKREAEAEAKKRDSERERKKRRQVEVTRLAADPRVTVFEVAFKFIAPKAGVYTMEVKTACDCYAGASKSHVMTMHVREAVPLKEAVRYESDEEEDEEEDEEDDEEEEDDDEEEEEEGEGEAGGDDDEDESEYEYIEVTASESEEGEFEEEDEEDEFGVSGESKGDPAAH